MYHTPGTGDRAAIHQGLEIGLPSSTRELPSAFAQGNKYIVHVHVHVSAGALQWTCIHVHNNYIIMVRQLVLFATHAL